MRVSYAPGYVAPITAGHIFPMSKFEILHRYLLDREVVRDVDVITPRLVDYADLSMVHTPRYLDGILNGNLTRKEERRLGLPWSPGLATRSCLAVQGTINASMMALQDGIAGNLAGGTHHAMPDHGEGFCVFNDVAVAINTLRRGMWIRRALIIDLDVHQGNGNAAIFADEPDVFTFSMHGEKNYPFQKPPSSLDIGLPDGTTDAPYLKTLGDALDDIFSRFQPDLVFYLGGIDPLEQDHFGRLALTMDGLRRREHAVIDYVKRKNIPLVLLLAGGYAPTPRDTAIAHAQMFEIAAELYG
ncbi:MAG: histone deacetylase [Candidatus Cyclonatronum sp.]|uniref:histone deacetylase family protein n=1 Tax=Cyclonatronum sp. TaxID=3024185 RepID=UPI00343F596C|nr:histone deacetylase [Cyclonatronum sp.]